MSNSTANVTVTNMTVTPMRVTYNGVDLGGTKGGVSFAPKLEFTDIMADQFGKTTLDKRVSGYQMSIKFELAEIQLKSNWKVAFPSMKSVGSGAAIYADMQIGDSLLGHASPLILHPLDHLDSDLTGDIKVYKAACVSAPELKFSADGQTVLSVEMVVFPDTAASPARFFFFGDPANGLVNASAGVPSFTGTGNGTVTSVSVVSGTTKTETITAKCLDAGVGGNDFYISGSVSGALGTCHVAAASSSTVSFVPATGSPQVITFTITQGSTQFVANDTFTIATTAANYA